MSKSSFNAEKENELALRQIIVTMEKAAAAEKKNNFKSVLKLCGLDRGIWQQLESVRI